MDGEDAAAYTRRIARENHEKLLARITAGKAAAPPDKEPIDLERVKRESRTATLGAETDDELLLRLEDLYYVDHPEYLTNQELIDLVALLANYD
jgi:hypothetical protein